MTGTRNSIDYNAGTGIHGCSSSNSSGAAAHVPPTQPLWDGIHQHTEQRLIGCPAETGRESMRLGLRGPFVPCLLCQTSSEADLYTYGEIRGGCVCA